MPYETAGQRRAEGVVERNPERTLRCASLSDDFYSNLLDWSGDTVYYSVENTVYGYNFHSGSSMVVFAAPGTVITAVKYSAQRGMLAVGTGAGALVLVDPATHKAARYAVHRGRIGALTLLGGDIVTGSRDRKARIFDVRLRTPVAVFAAHAQEVCGLAVNSEERNLASGGNDNRVFVFDVRSSARPLARLGEHRAAVKALAWAPRAPGLLLTGGGTADRTVRLWDLAAATPLVRARPFESQICGLRWLRSGKVLASFGYSNDDVKLLTDFRVERRFVAHRNRVIHLAVDDDQHFFASGSSDATIRFWSLDARQELSDIQIR